MREKTDFFKDKRYNENRENCKNNYHEEDTPITGNGEVRLNRYIANSGVCSRRDADKIIADGKIKVNGIVVTKMGTKIKKTDSVSYNDNSLVIEKKIYLILNKPRGYVTTLDDPHAEHTVMELIEGACTERIYPVGRLDMATTGLLLFTNDGELAKKLTHPSFEKKKIYQVTLTEELKEEDRLAIKKGFELEDGWIAADNIDYSDPEDRKTVGVEIHSGRNRIVRRIFLHMGYKVAQLDRVFFAGLTKKKLPRGKWRFLTKMEINYLKMV
ncbi:MAG: rRNA pseudouridine synthase [Prolixibacteraceae bacterium]|nr:rRNA pseudouridine synthase [Prolixibacteraceae bacterium]